MFGCKPFAGARETRLHFIRYEEDAVLAADILEKLEIIMGRNDETAFAENRLGDYGGDGLRCYGTFESVFQMMREIGGSRAGWIAIGICERNTIDVAGE